MTARKRVTSAKAKSKKQGNNNVVGKAPARFLPGDSGAGRQASPVNTGRKQERSPTKPAAVNTAKEQQEAVPQVASSKPPAVVDRSPPARIKTVREPGRAPGHLLIERAASETMEETDARMISSPAVASSVLIRVMASKGMTSTATDATMLHDVIAHKIAQVNAGDLTEVEGMLMAGACTMQAVSSEFIRRASLCLDNPNAAEIYMRVGLKAAGQMRANLEAVAEIKNPRPVFAKQTNIANGSQQVNNATGPQQVNNEALDRARESENLANKLLETA